MYLKSIEMQGFKSFALRTRLEFHNGVTGIVGPNGSGKSNVGDAVRWVLGEQSAKSLRGGNMQDVIFAGTENRKPVGFAMVAITLDNADRKLNFDADEVTVMRKLYRSGESEYQLNGRSCRLRDINELFYDTGIGKEGYSIIGQGQVEKILSGKPEERRELFDEAAGIVKFKRRKATALKKLEDEEANLVRVNDILSEVTRQIGPLEKQSGKAEEYLRKRDSLRTLDIQLFQIDEGRTEEQLRDLNQNKQIAEEHLADLNVRFEETRLEYQRVEKELEDLEASISTSRDSLQAAALEKQQHEGQINVLREQIRAAETNRKLLHDRLDTIEEDKASRIRNADEQRQEQQKLTEKLTEAEKERDARERDASEIEAEIAGKNSAAEQSRSDTIALLNNRTTIRERLQRYDTMLEQIEIRKSELSSRILQMKENESREKENLRKYEEEFSAVSSEVEKYRKSEAEKEKQIIALKHLLDEENHQLETGQTAYHREASRLESLRNIAERYEGYGNSIKRVMEQKDSNPGIHGVVADLIKTDKKYETAIETALGGALQNIVTDNESTAKYLIEYLKRGHFGRATFLPLTAMRDDTPLSQNIQSVLREDGVLGVADTLVSCDKIYQSVIRRLLGKTVVVDTIDHAIAVSRRHRQSVRMVTLEGELLSPGGSMTGGSFKYNSNLLGRRRQIKELESSVQSLKKEMQELQKKIEGQRAQRNDLRSRLAEEQDALQKLLIRQNTARVNRDGAKEKSDSLSADFGRLTAERDEINGQIAEIREKRSLIGGELESSQKEEENLEDKLRQITDESQALRQKQQNAIAERDQARLTCSNIRQQAAFLEEKLRTTESEIRRLDEERETLLHSIDDGESDTDSKESMITAIQNKIDELTGTISDAREYGESLQTRKEELTRNHREFFEKRDRLSTEKTEMDQEIFRLDSQIEKLREQKENQINYLYEEYQITPDQAEAVHFDEMPDRTPLRRQITQLKSEIKALGTVNVNAIEEYRELKERHDFLQSQHDDLIKASDDLKGIIRQLDEGMRKQFKERFEQIRVEFNKVFQQLFGGGKGTLELTDEENILESGITITSQPPGKKLQNMMQLSGGEKALTAIALLFAIQNLKPSPFCLLDEIEAALDDNNVGRFAAYLHKLTKNTQFIIITHRRGTMAAADRLYGITMQEKGVSVLVSVDLIREQLDN
ncbi:chromosome segregation protein SMC [Bilifractor sp. LCP21S3_A7]|uniref:chromosome segregation protein SMC n=1 Tax=Bilifractor sp. LCP21S3_A7 TaxID=3438738 RepID=UPI003F918FB1